MCCPEAPPLKDGVNNDVGCRTGICAFSGASLVNIHKLRIFRRRNPLIDDESLIIIESQLLPSLFLFAHAVSLTDMVWAHESLMITKNIAHTVLHMSDGCPLYRVLDFSNESFQ